MTTGKKKKVATKKTTATKKAKPKKKAVKKTVEKKELKGKTKFGISEPVKAKNINKFVDSKSSAEAYYRDHPNEKKMYKGLPTHSKRPSNLVDVNCTRCNREFEVSKILLHPYDQTYTCDKCIMDRR